MAVTKLVERCFISDLALVSSPEVACGFRYDSNHRVLIVMLENGKKASNYGSLLVE